MSIQITQVGVCYWVGNHNGTEAVAVMLDAARMRALALGLSEADINALAVQS